MLMNGRGEMPIGPAELIILLLIVVFIFGAGKLGNVGGALGKSIKDFRQEVANPDSREHGDAGRV
jgi:sec-independent protein translocase protein TatA